MTGYLSGRTIAFRALCNTGGVSIIFLSGPIGAGKTAVAKALLPLLPAPLSYIEGDMFWSFINKGGERGLRDNFPVLVRSMTAAAVPFARSGFRVLIDFSIPPIGHWLRARCQPRKQRVWSPYFRQGWSRGCH